MQYVKKAGLNGRGHYWVSQGKSAAEKRAFSGGGDSEGFEQAFSALAYTYMKNKAPRLLDFLVGFQLVDRNDDNTKAVGIFGFQLGEQWLYAPVFFLNGDLKGHELLYVKSQDMFVPMKESWVNYLMARKPHILGENSAKDTHQLGGLSPSLSAFQGTSQGIHKRGFDSWVHGALPLIAAIKTKKASALYKQASASDVLNMLGLVSQPFKAALVPQAEKFSLDKLLSDNFACLKSAFETSQRYPAIKLGFDKFYGPNCFSKWAMDCRQVIAKQSNDIMPVPAVKYAGDVLSSDLLSDNKEHPVKRGAIEIYVYDTVSLTRNGEPLDETGKEQLTSDNLDDLSNNGYLVKDERSGEEVSKAYNTQVEQKLTNPGESGLWQVLERPGSFDKMLVVNSPVCSKGSRRFATIVRLSGSGNKQWLNAHATKVWADKIETDNAFSKWFESLPDNTSLTPRSCYLAIGPDGSGTTPFEVVSNEGDGRYIVDYKANPNYDYQSDLLSGNDNDHCCGTQSYGQTMQINPSSISSSKLRVVSGELRVPSNFKFLSLARGSTQSYSGDSDDRTPTPPITPGRIEDIQLLFTEKTSRLKVSNDHNEIILVSPLGSQRMQKQAAMFSLITDHGLDEHTAKCIIKQSDAKQHQIFRVEYAKGFGNHAQLVKAADGYLGQADNGYMTEGPSAPSYQDQGPGMEVLGGRTAVRTRSPDEYSMPVDGLAGGQYDQSRNDIWQNYTHEDFQHSMGVAQQAAQTGQKEVFDTAMIGNMLKSVRQDSLVDRYLGGLLEALDNLGRILFMFYWHQEEFKDRYGEQELPELEDSLRNSFEGLGDVVLFLKEKSAETLMQQTSNYSLEDSARN